MKKPTILCIDPATKKLILVRKLDYQELKTGDSYLCLYLNQNVLTKFADDLGFDGELYVMSGGDLLYSSDKKVKAADDININQDFECIKRNYYTVDIEFYSCASKDTLWDFIKLNKSVLITLIVIVTAALIAGLLMALNIRRRIKPALAEYETNGSVNKDFLSKMKKGALLINTARGELVDTQALIDAIKSGHIAGAGLDTIAGEPVSKDNPIVKVDSDIADKLILSCHIGGITNSSFVRGFGMLWEDIALVEKGERPGHVVNKL